jgi:hypothetical protein
MAPRATVQPWDDSASELGGEVQGEVQGESQRAVAVIGGLGAAGTVNGDPFASVYSPTSGQPRGLPVGTDGSSCSPWGLRVAA